MPRARTPAGAFLAAALTLATSSDAQASGEDDGETAWHRFHLETGFFPVSTVQMIEGPNRDDSITSDTIVSSALGFSYAPIRWIETGIWMQLDGGSVERTVFSKSNEAGVATELDSVSGNFFELWTAFVLRGRIWWAFLEVGYAPAIIRHDTVRSDLESEEGDDSGLFEGSRSVAWLGAVGLSVPVHEHLDLTARLQYRIRYLVARGGAPLAREEETGQMALYPFVGVHAHF